VVAFLIGMAMPASRARLQMTGLAIDMPLVAAFGVASFVLAATPAPACSTSSRARWRRDGARGLASVAGVALGNLGNAMARRSGWRRCWPCRRSRFDREDRGRRLSRVAGHQDAA
jgi:hypothetical protein